MSRQKVVVEPVSNGYTAHPLQKRVALTGRFHEVLMGKRESASCSTSLLEQARAQEAGAWRRLTDVYGPCVYRWCRGAGLQSADAADVTQEVFQSVAAGIGEFRRDHSNHSFRAWLWTVYRSRLIDHFRLCRNQPLPIGSESRALLDAAVPDLTESLSKESDLETTRLVRRALKIIRNDFSDQTWQAFWRSTVTGERTCDVATELDMKPAAVCMSRSRVLRRLRETLEGLDLFPGN